MFCYVMLCSCVNTVTVNKKEACVTLNPYVVNEKDIEADPLPGNQP